MKKTIIFLALILCLTIIVVGEQAVGFNIHIINSEKIVSGGTTLWGLLASIVLLVLTRIVFSEGPPQVLQSAPNIGRRILAFLVDFFVLFLSATGILGLLPAIIEWSATSSFQWRFQRDFLHQSDLPVMFIIGMITLLYTAFYFGYPMRNNKQTLSLYVSGTIIVSTSEHEITWGRAFGRFFLTCMAVCAFPITLFIGRDKQGRFWHDKATDTNVGRVE